MSPVPRSGRKVTILLGIALMMALFAVPVSAQDNTTVGDGGNATDDANTTSGDNATGGSGTTGGGGAAAGELGVPADAPAPAEGHITRVLTVGVIDEGECPGAAPAPCWDVSLLAAAPGDVVVLHANLVNSAVPHNLHIIEPGAAPAAGAPGPSTRTAGNALHTASITMPDTGSVTFICDVHPDTMVGTIVTPAAFASAGGGHGSVPQMGVHFLAYWVGLIAFAVLFVVYGLTFFLFKYNETPATTDHWDRSEAGAENKRVAPYASLLAVVIALATVAGVIFIATMR